MGTYFAPICSDLFLFCYERDCMFSLSLMVLKCSTLLQDNLDDLLNVDNYYCEQMVSQIYPTEIKLNKREI